MGIHRAEQTIEIAASPEDCFGVITDYETFPDWQEAVIRVEVLERYGDGLGKIVEVTADAKFREVTYRLHYHYERPARISWDFVSGHGVEHIEGEYLLEPDDGGTLATYRLGIDPGVPVPALLARRLNRSVMKRSVEDLRDEVARRAAGGS
jgi:carbon monoxide dehydrogenase subunit G